MNTKILIALVLVISVFLVGCDGHKTSGYATYNQPQQQQYVGGGCGVAPSGDYLDTPIKALDSVNSVL